MPWEIVNHTRLRPSNAVPTPLFALEVQRGSRPGPSGAGREIGDVVECILLFYALSVWRELARNDSVSTRRVSPAGRRRYFGSRRCRSRAAVEASRSPVLPSP